MKRGFVLEGGAILGLVFGIILFTAVLLPVTADTVGTTTSRIYVTNESILGVNNTNFATKSTNVTANDAACAGDFQFTQVLAYNRSNQTAFTPHRLLSTPADYTGYANGTIFWNNVTQSVNGTNIAGYVNGNAVNVTYNCYVQNIGETTDTVLDLLPLFVAVGALGFIAFSAMGR